MKAREPGKEKRHGSLKRDQILLALATAGDVALESLYKIATLPIVMAEAHIEATKFGWAADPSKYGPFTFGEPGIFRDMAEMKIFLGRLRREGLVTQKKKGYTTITEKGMKMLTSSFEHPSYVRRYVISKKVPRILTMVIFDIPEKENEKRDWLRYQLKSLDFKRVQGSVWLGEHPLPDALLRDLRNYGMLSYIHIFSINRPGTISDLLTKFGFNKS